MQALFVNLGFQPLVFISSHRYRLICAESSTIPPHVLQLEIGLLHVEIYDDTQFVGEAVLRLPFIE